MTITIKDLAQMANTSTATVSRVLSNKPGVTPDRRERILQLAKEVGYTPNRLARNLALKKSYVLGFIAADLANPVYVEFLRRIQAWGEELGYQVLVADSHRNTEKERHNIEIMREHRAEGLIIFPVQDWKRKSNNDHLLELKLQKFPFVLGGKIDGFGFDYVTAEEIDTADKLTRHLIELGHRHIGFVGLNTENRCITERYEGFRKALREERIDFDEKRDVVRFKDDESWTEELVELLSRPKRPTALVMINDVFALLATRPLARMGIVVPRDLSVATFGNEIWAEHLNPSLTTTLENDKKVARAMMDLLLEKMEDPDKAPSQILIPQELLVRESTAPPPARS